MRLRLMVGLLLAALMVISCSVERPDESAGSLKTGLVPEDADLCGSWKMVELSASFASHSTDDSTSMETEAVDRHAFCQPIAVKVPQRIEVVGDPRNAKAFLTFDALDMGGRLQGVSTATCRYKAQAGASPAFVLTTCDYGFKAGDLVTARKFELELACNGARSAMNARVTLSDGSTPPADAYREFLGTTPNLKGVSLTVPVGAVPAYSGVGLKDGPPFDRHGFVAQLPKGAMVVGPSVEVTGPATFGAGVRLRTPYDAAYVAALPPGTASTLAIQHVAEVRGPSEAIRATALSDGVAATDNNIAAGLAASGFYLTTVKDETPITYWGGPLMNNGVHIYMIWAGNFDAAGADDPRAAIREFIADLPATTWYRALSQYSITNFNVTLAGEVTRNDVTKIGDFRTQLIQPAIDDGTLPLDPDGIYVVQAAPGVLEAGYCHGMCGKHNVWDYKSTRLKWAFVGHPNDCGACQLAFEAPHGHKIEGLLGTLAHEIVETVTDPEITGWKGVPLPSNDYVSQTENADKCVWIFSSLEGDGTPASPTYNMLVNGHKYIIQDNWMLDDGGYCGAGPQAVSISARANFDSIVMNGIGEFTVHVTNTGSVKLDAGQLAVVGRADGPLASDPLPVTIAAALEPGESTDVSVRAQAPYEIEGNVQSTAFRFRVIDRGNAHAFSAEGIAMATVKRAELLIDQSECTIDMPASVNDWTYYYPTVHLKNTGTTEWLASDYRLIGLPVDAPPPNFSAPALPRNVKPGETIAFSFAVSSPYHAYGQTLSVAVGMSNGAGYFQTGCVGETVDSCAPDAGNFCEHCGGTTRCDGSCSVHDPANYGQICDECGGAIQCGGNCAGGCHPVSVRLENVDDDAYVWIGDPTDTASAVCRASLGQTVTCDLTAIVAGRGLDMTSVPFTLKLGNGGGLNTQGSFFITIGGVESLLSRQDPVIAHTGWTHRQKFNVNFTAGTYEASPADSCTTIFDCMN